MKFVLFCHSLSSDWNHGNAHFLRGVVTELLDRGHEVDVFEPADGWSLSCLLETVGPDALEGFRRAYPRLRPKRYMLGTLDIDRAVDGADVVLVHEWNPLELLERLGAHRLRTRLPYALLFHDTHHRAVSAPEQLAQYPLERFDGTLAFGEAVAEHYRRHGWGRQVWVWHEAADTRVFRPPKASVEPKEDLIWIGNWGDNERADELQEFLCDAAAEAGVGGSVYGVRYPRMALRALARAELQFHGWTPNYVVPRLFHRHRFTVHIPRRFYREQLPGVPTIRVFEALACGIPLICTPWSDCENLFRAGRDFLVARDRRQMSEAMRSLVREPDRAKEMAESGLETIRRRHSCRHRVDELLDICATLRPGIGKVA